MLGLFHVNMVGEKKGFRSCKHNFRSVCVMTNSPEKLCKVQYLCKSCTNALHKTCIYIRIHFIAYLPSGTQPGVRYQNVHVVAKQLCLIMR